MRFPRVFHVALTGDDTFEGSEASPIRHIQTAAERAMPGDTVRVHAGIYRERIDPPRGGDSPERPITIEAAGNGEAVLCGSDVLNAWTRGPDGLWHAKIPEHVISGVNPFATLIKGDWFRGMGRPHHTAMLFLDGEELLEAPSALGLEAYTWFAEVEQGVTRIRADFGEVDPNRHLVEATTRPTVFYPSRTGIDHVVVRGLTLRHAATNWAPPTAEQPALLGTHWSKGWVIEDNRITHSRCVGISLGKYGDAHDNTSGDTAAGYVGTVERALDNDWDFGRVGDHTVRRNHIAHCEQAGIVGSLGAIRSRIVDNEIHHIHVHRLFEGDEQAGIKFHGAIDSRIEGNHIHHTFRALWMDWMTQGARIARNFCHHNLREDLFMEVNHGPCLVDHNLFLSPVSLVNWSEGTAYAHNLFAGRVEAVSDLSRETPCHPAHSTMLGDILPIRGGADRFVNNVVLDPGALDMDDRDRPSRGERKENQKVYPSVWRGNQVLPPDALRLSRVDTGWQLRMARGVLKQLPEAEEVTTETLGRSEPTGLPYESAEGAPWILDRDFFNGARDNANRVAGPFARNTEVAIRL